MAKLSYLVMIFRLTAFSFEYGPSYFLWLYYFVTLFITDSPDHATEWKVTPRNTFLATRCRRQHETAESELAGNSRDRLAGWQVATTG